jgi:multicomponent Na+:H+ antiporter subunit E
MTIVSRVQERFAVWPFVWLTAAWVFLWGNLSWFNVVSGALVASFVMLLFPLPRMRVPLRARPIAFLVLVVWFAVDLVRASIHVAWLAISPRKPSGGSLVRVRLRSHEELFQTIVAEMTGLVPGTVVIDLDHRHDELLLHCLDVHTPDGRRRIRRQVLRQEERVLRALDRHADEALAKPEPRPTRSATRGGER